MSITPVTKHYLEDHAEKESRAVSTIPYQFSHVLTIPVFNEGEQTIKLIESVKEKNCLIIINVNAMETSTPEVIKKNLSLLKTIRQNYFEIWRAKNCPGISLHQTPSSRLLLVDKTSGSLLMKPKTGVGLARKIIADIALALISENKVTSKWIYCTDADVVLPKNYFKRTELLDSNISAATYPYTHVSYSDDVAEQQAMTLYEISLRHYVFGLRYAGSPYAFPTIGSTIVIQPEAYAKVRGFPVREAAEDFYLMNKLAKVGKIKELSGDPVILDGRKSNRVPFGTGIGVIKISDYDSPIDDTTFYHPASFDLLKSWITTINSFTPNTRIEHIAKVYQQHPQLNQVWEALISMDVNAAIMHARRHSKQISVARKHLHTWFDAFRTLKLIHYIRDHILPPVSIHELIKFPIYQGLNVGGVDCIKRLAERFRTLESV